MRGIDEVREMLIRGEKSVETFIGEVLERIEQNRDYNAHITINTEGALERARQLDQKLSRGEELGSLFGVPISFKDNIMTEGIRTTCASKMLEHFVPPFQATVVERALAEDAVLIGKTNMDEFAMGGSSETSYFGPSKNPLDPTLVPGGSSSGAAVSLKLGESVVSIGSDTGGSVRQPASYCSLLGFLPSYGMISRHGVASMSNTLDQVGILANSVVDITKVFQIIGGNDPKDATSVPINQLTFNLGELDPSKIKVGILKDLSGYHCDPVVVKDYERAIERLRELGVQLIEVEMDLYRYLSPTYSVVCTAEVGSNMSKYDGLRYGYQCEDYEGLDELYEKTRAEGFREETQRRIAVGMFYLGSEYEVELYRKALKVREKIRRWVQQLFTELDFLMTPSAVRLPYPLGLDADTLSTLSSGDFHVLANLTGRCAISVPMNEGIGGSVQIMADRMDDGRLLSFADAFYRGIK